MITLAKMVKYFTLENNVRQKICSVCGVEKLLKKFGTRSASKNGKRSECKMCQKKSGEQYYLINKSVMLKKRSIYQKTEKGKVNHAAACRRFNKTDRGKIVAAKATVKYTATIRGFLKKRFYCIRQRCTDQNHISYHRYGGRGITCEFQNADEFMNYVISILRIDPRSKIVHRKNNDGNYCPGNIEFLTFEEHVAIHAPCPI